MSVFKKNGNWWIDCYINGQRVRRKVGPDKRTAELAEKDLKVREAKGEWLGIQQTKRITFESFCKEFMGKQAGKAKNTLLNYRQSINVHFLHFFGNLYLGDIRPKQIEDFKQARAKVAQFSTVNLQLQHLNTILNTAVNWGYLKENPAKGVKRLRMAEKEPPFMTRNQVAALYSTCQDWLYTFVAIALNTGLRISEILALTWEDVEMRNRVIKVRSDEDFTTKGKRNRELPINDFLLGVLKRHPRHITCPLVIYIDSGKSPKRSWVWARFDVARRNAGLPHFRIHDLRHTFGTTLAADGIDVVTIKDLMGHTDVKTTMKYLHAAPDRNRWAVINLRLDGTTQAEIDREKGHKDEDIVQAGGV